MLFTDVSRNDRSVSNPNDVGNVPVMPLPAIPRNWTANVVGLQCSPAHKQGGTEYENSFWFAVQFHWFEAVANTF